MTARFLQDFRRRVRAIGLIHDRGAYDYREHWTAFTRRLGLLRTADQIGREVAEEVMRATGSTSVGVYLTAPGESAYRLSTSLGSTGFVRIIDHTAAIPSWLRVIPSPARLPAGLAQSITTPAVPAALVAAIRWQATPLGFIVLAPRRKAADYAAADVEFLATVAEQAAAAIMAVRLPEPAAQPSIATFDRFTAAAIHDIKNAVSALSLLSRNAAANLADPEFQRDAITTLSRTVERMRRLLVRLSAPGAPPPPARSAAIDLRELVIEATRALAADGRVRLVQQLHPVKTVYGDQDVLLSVVENLAINAAEAIEHEGTVTVTLAEEQGHAIISVADTGRGIPAEYRERYLFSPFRSTKEGGWGIGLYQTKQAVESQDGEIFVESVEGLGTTFTVRLPLCTDAERPSLESVR
ncbi:MAG: ATP-binding protein [Candidatus Rokuibacteriota bacterium]